MTTFYLDTSAAAKLLVEEPESSALAEWSSTAGVRLVVTHLVETELRRLAVRAVLPQTDVTAILARLDIYHLPPSLFREAGILPGENLRSLDALHLAAAIRLGVDAIVTYDTRMTEAAGAIGLAVTAPR